MLSVSIARRIIMKATKKILCITLALVVAGLALIMPISASSADLPVIVVDGIGTTPLYQNFGTPEEKLVFDDATIEAMALGGNIMPHLHLPVQSGNNRVLKAMNRKYTREDYLEKTKL